MGYICLIHKIDCGPLLGGPRRFNTTVPSGAPRQTAGFTGRLRASRIQTNCNIVLLFLSLCMKE